MQNEEEKEKQSIYAKKEREEREKKSIYAKQEREKINLHKRGFTRLPPRAFA